MSRRSRKGRKSSSSQSIVPILVGVVIALVAVAAFFVVPKLLVKEKAPALDVSSYTVDGSRAHVGNTKSIIGKIINRYDSNRTGESILSVKVEGSEDESNPLGLFVTQEVRDQHPEINLDKGNAYVFKIKIDNDSHAKVLEISSK